MSAEGAALNRKRIACQNQFHDAGAENGEMSPKIFEECRAFGAHPNFNLIPT
jgi:hypothetical protein